ncbi:hypothetical protein AVEN_74585-1 [Araneus ventricosus]|uniref:Uncharacterized protein n=1 Tax=Araneus ventricosus TaxID=182803 RepID=A0A4Y2MH35_ARAVE|nr:hypothetical protein AVEN_74585-1 [Araneus ventricosus]
MLTGRNLKQPNFNYPSCVFILHPFLWRWSLVSPVQHSASPPTSPSSLMNSNCFSRSFRTSFKLHPVADFVNMRPHAQNCCWSLPIHKVAIYVSLSSVLCTSNEF